MVRPVSGLADASDAEIRARKQAVIEHYEQCPPGPVEDCPRHSSRRALVDALTEAGAVTYDEGVADGVELACNVINLAAEKASMAPHRAALAQVVEVVRASHTEYVKMVATERESERGEGKPL